jgi:hypothetical protein
MEYGTVWRTLTNRSFGNSVSVMLSTGIYLIFYGHYRAPVSIQVAIPDTEPQNRLLDINRPPVFWVDKGHLLSIVNYNPELVLNERAVSAIIWSGTEIEPESEILRVMRGKTLQAQISFKDGTGLVFDVPLAGFAELFDDIFQVNTCPMVTLPLLAADVNVTPPKTVESAIPEKQAHPLEHLLADLGCLIGLTPVKREVNSLVNLIKVRELRRKRRLAYTRDNIAPRIYGKSWNG